MHLRVLGWRLDGSLERRWISGCNCRPRNGSQFRDGTRLGRLRLPRGEVSNNTNSDNSLYFPFIQFFEPHSSSLSSDDHRNEAIDDPQATVIAITYRR